MSAQFYKQAVPEPSHVLGLRLLPLSVGHIILLHRIESAFVCSRDLTGLDAWHELALAAAICAQPYAESVQMLEDKAGTSKAMAKWAAKLTRTTTLDRLLKRKPVPIDFASQWQAFVDYLKEHSKLPYYSYNPEDVREMDCPHVQLVKCSLQRSFGFTDEAILNRSWSQCLWDYVTLKALDGQIQMADEDEFKAMQKAADEMLERIKQAGGINGSA